MRNRFPGICYRCGREVKTGQGHFERVKGDRKWLLQHAACAIKYRGKGKG